jgi:hypothetical protein
MFICLICLLHLQAMFNFKMDLCSYFTCLHVLELLLFVAAIISYGIYLSYMIVLFGIRIFNLFKYEGNMSLISLNITTVTTHYSREAKQSLCRWKASAWTWSEFRLFQK